MKLTTPSPAPTIELLDQYTTEDFKAGANACPLVLVSHKCITPSVSAKSAYLLEMNIKGLGCHYGPDQLFFLTLTFPGNRKQPEKDKKKALHRFTSNVLNRNGIAWVRVLERHKSRKIHYHMVLAVHWDATDEVYYAHGIDPKAPQPEIDKHFSGRVLALSKELSEKLPNYGFGRWNMSPVISLDGIASYLSKSLRSPNNQYRKRDRKWSCSKRDRRAKGAIAWVGGRAKAFRQAHEYFAFGLGIDSYEEFTEEFEPRWFYYLKDELFRFSQQILDEDVSEIVAHVRDRVFHDEQHGAFYRPHPRRKWRSALPAQPEKEGGCALG